jgi:mannopine transport system substrate-binding protein
MRSHSPIKRRRNMLLAAAFVVALAAAGVAYGASSASKHANAGHFVFVAPGGSYQAAVQAAYITPFEKATGISVQLVAGGDNPVAAVRAQVQSHNVQWDLAGCGIADVIANPDIWGKIDTKIVKRKGLFYKQEFGSQWVVNDVEAWPTMDWSKTVYTGAQPKSWADFWNFTKFPGPRGVPNVGLDSAWLMPAVALLADGVKPSKLVPFDLNRAYRKLDQLKPHVRVFWTTFSQSQDVLRSGEVAMNIMTDGRAEQLVGAGEPVGVSFNNAFRFTASWCSPKGAPNRKNAFRFMQWVLSHPKGQAQFTKMTRYGPPTIAGAKAAKKLGVSDFSTRHAKQMIPDSPKLLNYIRNNAQTLLNRWNSWVSG